MTSSGYVHSTGTSFTEKAYRADLIVAKYAYPHYGTIEIIKSRYGTAGNVVTPEDFLNLMVEFLPPQSNKFFDDCIREEIVREVTKIFKKYNEGVYEDGSDMVPVLEGV
jgi:hypothetical protein